MTAQPVEAQEPFKDYFLILQVHPEADAGMVEAAYWHLAKRYNKQSGTDQLANAKLDDLNEAYNVLGTPNRREQYNSVRNDVLGEGTLPMPAEPQREPPPLAVLEKQKPRSRETAIAKPGRKLNLKFDLRLERFVEPSWPNTAVVLIGLILTTSLVAVSAAQGYVLALLAASLLASAAPIMRAVSKTSFVKRLVEEPDRTTQLKRLSGAKRRR